MMVKRTAMEKRLRSIFTMFSTSGGHGISGHKSPTLKIQVLRFVQNLRWNSITARAEVGPKLKDWFLMLGGVAS
jgi:hypothetical protein